MAIMGNTAIHTVGWLKSQNDNGKLYKDISIQRKEVWDSLKKSNLVVSMLMNIPIESLLFERVSSDSYNLLDGKQRTLALCAFLDGKLALSKKIRVKEIDGVEIVGKRFADLPEHMQSKILERELSISILDPLDTEDRATVFFMRNQAVALTKMDLSFVIMGEDAMNAFDRLSAHPFLLEKAKLTVVARRKHEDVRALLQYVILRQRPEMGFSGNEIMAVCDQIKNGDLKIDAAEIEGVLDYLNEAFQHKRQYLKKVHLPSVLYVAQAAKEQGVSGAALCARMDAFFGDLDSHAEYVAACTSGSAKRVNVRLRVDLLSAAILAQP